MVERRLPARVMEGHAAATDDARADAAASRGLGPVAGMAALFLASIALAMLTVPAYVAQDVRAFEDPNAIANPIIYLVIVIAFTAVILYIRRKGFKNVIRWIMLGAVFMTMNYVAWPLLRPVLPDEAGPVLGGIVLSWNVLVAVGLATALVALVARYPEWWVIDAAGVVVSAGAAAIFGISFGLIPALLLLVAFAAYDFIAVYRTKHMIDLADSVLELRLPIMFVVPRKRGYSFLEETRRLKEKLESGEERDAMFMGLGDAVIPAVLVVSALHFLSPAAYEPGGEPAWLLTATVLGMAPWLFVALATLLGALVGYGALMWFVLQGKPQAGLPLLNGGAIVGFFAALLPLYGIAPVWPFG